jgi:hypothetical protein
LFRVGNLQTSLPYRTFRPIPVVAAQQTSTGFDPEQAAKANQGQDFQRAPITLSAMASMASNDSFTSILANTKYAAVNIPQQIDFVLDTVTNLSPWSILFTVLAVLVAYDQSEQLRGIQPRYTIC